MKYIPRRSIHCVLYCKFSDTFTISSFKIITLVDPSTRRDPERFGPRKSDNYDAREAAPSESILGCSDGSGLSIAGVASSGDVVLCTEIMRKEAELREHDVLVLSELITEKDGDDEESGDGVSTTNDLAQPQDHNLSDFDTNQDLARPSAISKFELPPEIKDPLLIPRVMKSRRLENSGKILTPSLSEVLRSILPLEAQDESLRLIYSVLDHGCDTTAFFTRTRGYNYTVILVQAASGEIFGGFNAVAWKQSLSYYGSGESIVFKLGKLCIFVSVL
jgi:hypothetical protein